MEFQPNRARRRAGGHIHHLYLYLYLEVLEVLNSRVCVSSSNIRISTWFVISNNTSSGAADPKCCTTISRRICGSTGRTQGIPASGVNGRRVRLGFKLAWVDSEHKDEEDEDTAGASIGTRVSCGALGGEWESRCRPRECVRVGCTLHLRG